MKKETETKLRKLIQETVKTLREEYGKNVTIKLDASLEESEVMLTCKSKGTASNSIILTRIKER